MKIKELKSFLKVANKIKITNILPDCKNILVKDDYLIYGNLEIIISKKFDGLELINGELIDLKTLIDFSTSYNGDEFFFDIEEDKLIFVSGKTSGLIGSSNKYSTDKHILPIFNNRRIEYSKLCENDIKSIKKVSNYLSKDEFRPLLTAVLVDNDYIYGTNSMILGYNHRVEASECYMLISPNVIRLLEERSYIIFKDSNSEIDGTIISFLNEDGLEITFKKYVGKTPCYDKLIPIKGLHSSSFTLNGKCLGENLKLMKTKGIKSVTFCYCGTDLVIISGVNHDKEIYFEKECNGVVVGESDTITFEVKLLLNIVDSEKNDEYCFYIREHNMPVVINDNVLIMPIR